MTTTRKRRPRSFAGALSEWDAAVALVHAEPTDANLQALVSLLDSLDTDLVRRWGTDGHDWRRAAFGTCRAAARRANAAVTAAQATAAQERAQAAWASRRAREAAEAEA